MSTQTFMVVATIREDTDLAALTSLIPDEMASVERLREQGKLGSVHVAFARRVIFIEACGADEADVTATVRSLPMGGFFDLDVYPTAPGGTAPGGNAAGGNAAGGNAAEAR